MGVLYIFQGMPFKIYFLGSKEEDEVACFFVFSHIQMRDHFRLGRVNECPHRFRKLDPKG